MAAATEDETHGLAASPQALQEFHETVAALWCPSSIPRIPVPSSLKFLRDYISVSRPCIIQNAVNQHYTLDDIVSLDPSLELQVDVTPNGHGDCVHSVDEQQVFVMPETRSMKITDFRDALRSSDQLAGVPYYSRQNDCLRKELSSLWDKNVFPQSFDWAEEAFNVSTDAVNLWIGNEKAVSAMHKDHYENLFYVASGEKIFTLCPPADAAFLYERDFPSGTFDSTSGEWAIRKDDKNSMVKWIAANLNEPDNERFPLLRYAHPIQVRVKAGEMLYLPSLWFHSVTQSCETVAINYWYDMRFDSPHWCYFSFLQQLSTC
jgi:jumonji domain-containing protein 7